MHRKIPVLITLVCLGFVACRGNNAPTPEEQRRTAQRQLFGAEIANRAEIPPAWHTIGTLSVARHAEYSVVLQAATVGRANGNNTTCEFVTSHPRIRAGRRWSPLPVAVYTQSDPNENVDAAFDETLTFRNPDSNAAARQFPISASEFSFVVDFRRAKIFRSLWRVRAVVVGTEQNPRCRAFAEICYDTMVRDGVTVCRGNFYALHEISADINDDILFQLGLGTTAQRDRDDLRSLTLTLQNLDGAGRTPSGDTFTRNFTDFIVE